MEGASLWSLLETHNNLCCKEVDLEESISSKIVVGLSFDTRKKPQVK
jgi:hypothetical protein